MLNRKVIEECEDLNVLYDESEKVYKKCIYYNDCSICPCRNEYKDVMLFEKSSCTLGHLTKRIQEIEIINRKDD